MWASPDGDDVRVRVCENLWPQEWIRTCSCLCRVAKQFFARREVVVGLLSQLPEDTFALTAPFWPLLRRGIGSGAVRFLEPAFAVMGSRQAGRLIGGDAARLLGRCFTVAAHLGSVEIVAVALRSGADVEQRINGQSALDGAAQAGRLDVVEALLAARAAAAQTAPGRWTPLMRAALAGHAAVCSRLLEARAPADECAERATALDVAEANARGPAAEALRARAARRFLELRPEERGPAAPAPRPLRGGEPLAAPRRQPGGLPRGGLRAGGFGRGGRLRPGPHELGGGLPRGILTGSAVLHLREEADESEDTSEHNL